ncbi:MAG: hypothetical protein SFZ02_18445 [bacterium]|nr:hypothetical protein [bacterium]
MSRDEWIADRLAEATLFSITPLQIQVISALVDIVMKTINPSEHKLALASVFDLLVSAEYYGLVGDDGWLRCSADQTLILYPYTNICPHCIKKGNFVYHRANKPKSGVIGATTSKLLAGIIQEWLKHKNLFIRVLKGKEPIDIILSDETTSPIKVFFGEIKASPLITFPLCIFPPDGITQNIIHAPLELKIIDTEVVLCLPDKFYSLGRKTAHDDTTWAMRGLLILLEQPTFFVDYFNYWKQAFIAYAQKNFMPIYWLTNGCGQPVPRPVNWVKRGEGGGYESVSDSKTSVGMDRTDDIKKGIYQVFNLSIAGKPSSNYDYKVGLVSNVHAVRHYDDYLSQFADIVWTHRQSDTLYNLFDGIIALTQTITNDEWLRKIFDF